MTLASTSTPMSEPISEAAQRSWRASPTQKNGSPDSRRPYREKLSLAVLALGAIALLFWRLGAASLNDWDEAIYAQVAKELATTGDWLTLHWGYAPWFHKPPLFMWMTATAFKLFGVSEFWARVPSALSGVGLVGCTYAIARKLYGSNGRSNGLSNGSSNGSSDSNRALGHAIGLLSATVLLTNYTFIHFSRFGTTDITLTLFCYLAVYFYLHVHEGNQRAWYGVWASVALALMTKGVAGVPVAIALFLAVLLTGRLLKALRSRSFWLGIGLAGLIVVPWHWAMIAIHGQAFINEYLIYHVLERSTGGGLEGNSGGIFYYFSVLGKRFFPWVYLLPLALLQQVRWLRQPKGSMGLVLWIFVGVVFGGFSLASTKLAWYIIPIYPALAIWIGALLHQAIVCKDRLVWMGLLVSGTIVMALFPTEIVFLSPALTQGLTIVGLAGLMLLSVAVLEFGWRRQVLSIALCGLFIVAGVREIKGSYHGYARPVATLSQAAELPVTADDPPKDMPLLVAKLSERLYTPTPLFYSNRPIAWVRSAADLAAATETGRKQDILLATTDIQDLSARYYIDVYANEGALTFAGIRKRDL